MIDAGPEVDAVVANRVQGLGERGAQFGAVLGAAIGEHSLGEFPDALVGIQLGSVARETQEV